MSQAMHAVERKFHAAMTAAPISFAVNECRRMITAYSGGADSSALLVLMHRFCEERGIPLLAVHVHHGIRGVEADRDAALCSAFCCERGIELRVEHVDAPAYAAAHGVGLEEAARTLRYEVLAEIAAQTEKPCIATAHSADDNLETVLFRMARGTALDGLCGIPPVRDSIIRPLLGCSAEEIRDFCKVEHIPYVTDSTNTDTAYTRNYIREEITPHLQRIAPSPEKTVQRMCESLRSDAEYLHAVAAAALGDAAAGTAVPLCRIASLHDAVLSRCVVILYGNAAGSRRDLTAVHIRDVMRAVRAGGFSRVSLPGEMTAVIAGGRLSVECGRAEIPTADENFCESLGWGDTLFPQYGFGIRIARAEEENLPEKSEDWKIIYKLSIRTSIPFDTIIESMFVRFRKGGDELRSGGMTRSVKKLLNAAKIPPAERVRLPVICDAEGILWIPGLPVRDGVLCEDAREDSVILTYFLL